jgi:hypothetical protein
MPRPPSIDDHYYGRDIPLKAVRVHTPDRNAIHYQNKYPVHIEPSRNGSKWEIDAVRKNFPQGRFYGNTLELSQTTVESVAEGAQAVSSQLAALEREACKSVAAWRRVRHSEVIQADMIW